MVKQRIHEDFERRAGRRKVFLLIVLLALVFSVGTLGYMTIEGWNAFDSFFMTVITLATIGYGETHPLTTAGRAFTIFLIFVGLGIFTVMVGTVSRVVLEGQFNKIFNGRRRMREQVARLSNHTIFSDSTSDYIIYGGGSSLTAISGTLDRVRVITVNGTDTFDTGGVVNILYE